jgi:hypothetical protein
MKSTFCSNHSTFYFILQITSLQNLFGKSIIGASKLEQ